MTTAVMAEWVGCWTGLAGATLLALNCRYSSYGWIFFLVSNISWIIFAVLVDINSIGIQHIGFMATSLLGIYRWLMIANPQRDQKVGA